MQLRDTGGQHTTTPPDANDNSCRLKNVPTFLCDNFV